MRTKPHRQHYKHYPSLNVDGITKQYLHNHLMGIYEPNHTYISGLEPQQIREQLNTQTQRTPNSWVVKTNQQFPPVVNRELPSNDNKRISSTFNKTRNRLASITANDNQQLKDNNRKIKLIKGGIVIYLLQPLLLLSRLLKPRILAASKPSPNTFDTPLLSS